MDDYVKWQFFRWCLKVSISRKSLVSRGVFSTHCWNQTWCEYTEIQSTFHRHLQSQQPTSLQVDPESITPAEQTDMPRPYVVAPADMTATLMTTNKLTCNENNNGANTWEASKQNTRQRTTINYCTSSCRTNTPCPKKRCDQTHSGNFVKSQPIFKILSPLEKEGNLQ